jgi:cell division transport system permease protein
MVSLQHNYNKRKIRASYFTTIVSISLVLFMLGALGFLMINAKKVGDFIKENIELELVISDVVKEKEVINIKNSIDKLNFTKDSHYISKETAAEKLTKELGEDFVSFLGYNPLKPSIEVHMKAAWSNSDSLALIKKKLLALSEDIIEVHYQETLLQAINKNIQKISLIIIVFSAILLFISLALINNTIRLFVYSRRFTIRTMQLVGATERFIRKPFIKLAIFQGFISSIIAIVMIAVALYFLHEKFSELVSVEILKLTAVLFLLIMVFGMIISWIASFFSVRKYLKTNTENLYY